MVKLNFLRYVELFVCLFRVRYIGSYLILIKKSQIYIYLEVDLFHLRENQTQELEKKVLQYNQLHKQYYIHHLFSYLHLQISFTFLIKIFDNFNSSFIRFLFIFSISKFLRIVMISIAFSNFL